PWCPPVTPAVEFRPLAGVWQILLAGLLCRLELGIVLGLGHSAAVGAAALYDDPAVGGGVGPVDAVPTHAPGELHQLLPLLRVELEWLAAVGQVLVAGLLRRLELRVVRAFAAGTGLELLGDPVPADLRVGHVDAVLAHAPGKLQRRLLRVLFACWAGAGRGGGLVRTAEAGHPIGVVAVVAAARDHQHEGQRAQERGQPWPPAWACRDSPAAVIVHRPLLSSLPTLPGRAAPGGLRAPLAPSRTGLAG